MASSTSPGQDGTAWSGSDKLTDLNAGNVNLTAVAGDSSLMAQVVCYIEAGSNDYTGGLGVRISALFVILVVSSAVTFFPLIATNSKRLHIPLYVYLFARYFGAGVIIATAFVHLLDPAYAEIGPNTCVGMTGGWSEYSWPPALALTSSMMVFLMDFAAERYVEKKYGLSHAHGGSIDKATLRAGSVDAAAFHYDMNHHHSTHHGTHQHLHSGDQDHHHHHLHPIAPTSNSVITKDVKSLDDSSKLELASLSESEKDLIADRSFKQQIAAFLILEFGVLFHSVIIGLTLGSAGSEFATLYVVIVFHQSFEGLGLGARLSAIPFPKRYRWLPWWLCAGYGLTTPIAIAAGLGVRTTYNAGSFTANVVSGVLDSISAGILLYTGFVELLARDFLFNPDRTDDDRQLLFMLFSLLLGAALMALLGKWA